MENARLYHFLGGREARTRRIHAASLIAARIEGIEQRLIGKAEPGFPVEAEAAGELTPCQLEVGQRRVSGPGHAASHTIWRHQTLAGHRREGLIIDSIDNLRRLLWHGTEIVSVKTERS